MDRILAGMVEAIERVENCFDRIGLPPPTLVFSSHDDLFRFKIEFGDDLKNFLNDKDEFFVSGIKIEAAPLQHLRPKPR